MFRRCDRPVFWLAPYVLSILMGEESGEILVL